MTDEQTQDEAVEEVEDLETPVEDTDAVAGGSENPQERKGGGNPIDF